MDFKKQTFNRGSKKVAIYNRGKRLLLSALPIVTLFYWACLTCLFPVNGFSIERKNETIRVNQGILADTIIQPSGAKLASDTFIQPAGGLPVFAKLVKQHKLVKVAFLGGSITDMQGWRGKVMDYLTESYPESKFEFLNAGIPSLGSVPHAFRLQQDVLDKMIPDLLFIESAVNDAGNGTTETEQRRALEGIIRHAHRANPKMDMILMAFAEERKNAIFAKDSVPTCVKVHNELAAYYHFPFINLAKEVYSRINHGEFTWEKDFKSLHPAPFGQQLYFNAIKSLLESEINGAGKQKSQQRYAAFGFPEPMQPFNYNQGHYVDLSKAVDLKGFAIVNDWTPKDQAHTRKGFVHVPVLCATDPGSELVLKFKGTAVGIAVVSGPDAGIIRYRVDGSPTKTMNLYTQWSSQLHLPWYELLGDGLTDGNHVLKLEITSGKKKDIEDTMSPIPKKESVDNMQPKTAVRIVHFLVNG